MLSNEIVTEKAKNLGFDLIGFAEAKELNEDYQRYIDWLEKGYNADMEYMKRNREKRKDVQNILHDAKSVISLGMNYYTPYQHTNKAGMGKISRYAWGKDYHLIIWEKLDELINELKQVEPAFEARSYVDTGPVMDKTWAVRSGIGWMGKHTNVINREIGSWFFIANIICNKVFNYSKPIEDYCGSCTACIDACPTGAIVDEYIVDANKCISYLTIENKGEIPDEFSGKFKNWIFGCDICQDVCPWNNKFSVVSMQKEFNPVNSNREINIKDVRKMEQDEFSLRFKLSPVKRTKLNGLKRNALFLMKNKEE